MANQPMSTIGVLLSYGKKGETMKPVYSIISMPQLVGAPAQTDASTMYPKTKAYVPGQQENAVKEFPARRGPYGPPNATEAQMVNEYARALEDASNTELYDFRIDYPDDSKHEWSGYLSAGDDAMETDGVQNWILYSTPTTEVKYTPGTGQTG